MCPNFEHPVPTSIFTKYKFLLVKNSFARITNGRQFWNCDSFRMVIYYFVGWRKLRQCVEVRAHYYMYCNFMVNDYQYSLNCVFFFFSTSSISFHFFSPFPFLWLSFFFLYFFSLTILYFSISLFIFFIFTLSYFLFLFQASPLLNMIFI